MTINNIDYNKILFSRVADSETNIYIPFLIVFSMIILASIAVKLFSGDDKKISNHFFWPLMTSGIVGLIYLFARHEGLPWLSSGIVIFSVFVFFFASLVWNGVWLFRYIPKIKKEKIVEERYKKYLPKSKKK